MNDVDMLRTLARATSEMFSFADRLAAAQRRIAELEAQLAGAAVKIGCVTEGKEVSGDGES